MAESTMGGFLVLAIIVIAGLILALGLLYKMGFFTPSEKAATKVVVTVTWEQLLEQAEQKKQEWIAMIAPIENAITLPTPDECDALIAIRDEVARIISEAASLGAPVHLIKTATDGLAEINKWLSGWNCL